VVGKNNIYILPQIGQNGQRALAPSVDGVSRTLAVRSTVVVKMLCFSNIFTGSIARSANLPVFSLLRGRF